MGDTLMLTLRPSQAQLHTWSGLLMGWALYVMFLAGTASFWRDEISRWARPELGQTIDRDLVLTRAQAFLARTAPDAHSWTIQLPTARNVGTNLSWQAPAAPGAGRGRSVQHQWLDGVGEPVAVRETRGGDFFYRLHFDFHYVPALWARWFAGFCAVLMLTAIVSGVITHKKIFKDFFTLRLGKGQRSWLDGHNVCGVLALPFHLMITYTGLVTLMTVYMPWGALAHYADSDALSADRRPRPALATPRADTPAPLADIRVAVAAAEQRWGGTATEFIHIINPGDAAARMELTHTLAARIRDGGQLLTFDGVTGALLNGPPPDSPAISTRDAMVGLHAGRFAGLDLRWLYFISSLAGTVMVASGAVLWTVKRREKLKAGETPHAGLWLAERLNAGFIAGLPLGMTTFMWANRLLPLDLPARAAREIDAMFIIYGLALVWSLVRPPKQAWVELFAATAAALAGLALFGLLATDHGLWAAARRGDAAMAAIEASFVVLAAAFAAMSWAIRRRSGTFTPAAPDEGIGAVARA